MRLKIYLLFLIEQKDFYFGLENRGLHLLSTFKNGTAEQAKPDLTLATYRSEKLP